ncbi:fimbria/pilus chaperone family protein [Citrobacter amalonaticus]|nr:fimbria/pilus chaperone family protein [Citrobacter amalonaticus]
MCITKNNHFASILKKKRTSVMASLLATILGGWPLFSLASGVLPETTTVIINEAQKGGSINVKNTENVPVLLYTKIVDLPDDPEPALYVTQPVVRLEPGQTQRVRFVLNTNTPLEVEHIKRVYFEGVTEKKDTTSVVAISIRQDLPVLIVPGTLRPKQNMWTDLNWSASGDNLKVTNTSKQVVRLVPQIKFLPSGSELSLGKSYILPHETLTIAVPANLRLNDQRQVEFSPVSRYGFDVGLQISTLAGK